MRRAAATLLCAAAGACGESPPPPPADAGPLDAADCAAPAELALGTAAGTSASTYRALAEGDPAYLTPGPQGGQHIWVALRGRGFDPTLPRFEFRAYRPSDGALIGRLRVRLPMILAPEDPALYALASQTLVIDDRAYCSVLGGAVRVELDFDDLHGRCTTLRRTVRLADLDPATPEATRAAWRRCCDERLPRCFGPMDASAPADAAAD